MDAGAARPGAALPAIDSARAWAQLPANRPSDRAINKRRPVRTRIAGKAAAAASSAAPMETAMMRELTPGFRYAATAAPMANGIAGAGGALVLATAPERRRKHRRLRSYQRSFCSASLAAFLIDSGYWR